MFLRQKLDVFAVPVGEYSANAHFQSFQNNYVRRGDTNVNRREKFSFSSFDRRHGRPTYSGAA